jgi:hypothetical protein
MNESNECDLTSGEGSILVEIVAEALPVTPDVLERDRQRRLRLRPGCQTDGDPPPVPPPSAPPSHG